VVITGVLHNGPAAKAGIRPGDVIMQVDNQAVGSVSELLTQVANLKPGSPTDLKIWRKQGELMVKLIPAERPSVRKNIR
jgi:S1-C subfamily serine protease